MMIQTSSGHQQLTTPTPLASRICRFLVPRRPRGESRNRSKVALAFITAVSIGSICANCLMLRRGDFTNNGSSFSSASKAMMTAAQPRIISLERSASLDMPLTDYNRTSHPRQLKGSEMTCARNCRGIIVDEAVQNGEKIQKHYSGYDNDHCEPIQEWPQARPLCNEFHAVSFVDTLVARQGSMIAAEGSWRRGWEMKDTSNVSTAWKTLK